MNHTSDEQCTKRTNNVMENHGKLISGKIEEMIEVGSTFIILEVVFALPNTFIFFGSLHI